MLHRVDPLLYLPKTNVAKRMCSEGLATTMLQTLPTDGSTASRKMMAEAAELVRRSHEGAQLIRDVPTA